MNLMHSKERLAFTLMKCGAKCSRLFVMLTWSFPKMIGIKRDAISKYIMLILFVWEEIGLATLVLNR